MFKKFKYYLNIPSILFSITNIPFGEKCDYDMKFSVHNFLTFAGRECQNEDSICCQEKSPAEQSQKHVVSLSKMYEKNLISFQAMSK